MSLKFAVADLTIQRIVEQETPYFQALDLFPDLTPEMLREHRAWLRQANALDDDDMLVLCFQSYVVKTPHHTILIDSCIGNDKPRPGRPKWNMKTDDTYMRGLAAAGVSLDDIDIVMCTHLHADHVGWNTRLDNGRWVPTFPKARYLIGATELAHWQTAVAEKPAANHGSYHDSVLPVIEHGLVKTVNDGDDVAEGATILALPGHTPGQIGLEIDAGPQETVIFCGDAIHSPAQIVRPEWSSAFCTNRQTAEATRRSLIERA